MSQHEQSSSEKRWEEFSRFFVENKLIVFILLGVLVAAGLSVAPFDWELGGFPRDPVPVDALPDISENQQIVFTDWPGRSPRDVEDQITYPLTTALLGIPGVRSIRSASVFGFSSIYVIFEDEIDFYWSRSRVLEKLASLPAGTLPDDATPTLGPDATALGQVYWYTLQAQDEHGNVVPAAFSLEELRSVQDWNIRYALQSVPGVSEVASVGGYVREYQVDVDPEAMLGHKVTIGQVAKAVKNANLDTGARTIEINNAEYIIRGLGFIQKRSDLEDVVITSREHTPIRVRDIATVNFGPAGRRGALDDGGAEAVGGVVVVRFGDNPLAVIDRLREKIEEISIGLPRRTMDDGTVAQVKVVSFYDRTQIINETLDTLSLALIQQVLITVIVVLLIMRHLRTSLLISVLLPIGVLGTFVAMKYVGVDANVMALSGIAIAIGTMVDMGIVFTENIAERLDEAPPGEDRIRIVPRATGEVAAAVMTSVLTTVVGFVPIFGLTAAEGRLFSPLAYTKTFAIVAAFLISVIFLPPLAHLILRSTKQREDDTGRRPWRLLSQGSMVFNWVIVGCGIVLVATGLPLAGLLAIVVGGLELAAPWMPKRHRARAHLLAITIAIAGVGVGLTNYWMPLGPGRSLSANLLFVVFMVAILMLVFWLFQHFYQSILAWSLRHKFAFLTSNVAFVLLGVTAWLGVPTVFGWLPGWVQELGPYQTAENLAPGLQEDFMPPFDEGSFLLMPTTTPHASLGQALEMMSSIDAAVAAIPEVERAVGKLGRAESALDPAPISMFETVVNYHSEYVLDDAGHIGTFQYDEDKEEFVRDEHAQLMPDSDGRPFRQWRDHIRSPDDIWAEVTKAAQYPGLTGSPKLMPIKTRIVMLQTGMRSAVGMKIKGPDLETLEAFGLQVEGILKQVPEIESNTVLADRIVGKPYIEIVIDREAISRHGLTISDVQDVIQVAIGGRMLTRTVEGRERYPVRVRYMREERDSVEALQRVLVPMSNGGQIPLEQVSDIRYVRGPQLIRSEDTFLNAYVTFDPSEGIGEVESVHAAQGALQQRIESGELVIPAGVSYRFAGTYENQIRSAKRLMVLVPLALAIIFVLLYLQFRRTTTALMVFAGVALAASGGFLLIWAYGQSWFMNIAPFGVDLRDLFHVGDTRMTVAVWVGFLALFGIATDNGVIVATYLMQLFRGKSPTSMAEVHQLVIEAGQRRVRPCVMTTATTLLALLPVVTSPGRGSDLMVPMALPSIGGVVLALVTLFTVPVLYSIGEERRFKRRQRAGTLD
ncbi:MAG: efflux RND transporter permease subunit [Deltaproteobacteria bacterium]|nr:efflux RND transporter permease subunit [Deltaproteobacteria bacterium]